MGILDKWFKPRLPGEWPLAWDMHNHLLFGIDDGSKSVEQSLDMARRFLEAGYKGVIATPHVMSDYYPNTPEIIRGKCGELQSILEKNHIPLRITCAAEYYMDEVFYAQVSEGKPLLTLYGNHVLIETSFLNRPVFFNKIMFDVRTAGYSPILAHPERYIYLHENHAEAEEILASGVKFQINLLSLIGYYSPQVKKFAQWLIEKDYYHFLGTDAHTADHIRLLREVHSSKIFSRIDFTKVMNVQNPV